MRCTLAIVPSREVQERANSYRMRYDSDFAMIQPHIKLKRPFTIEDEDIDTLENHLEELTSEIEPFSISFHRIKTFFPTSPVIYMGIQNPKHIVSLHQKLNSNLLYREEKYVFTPHLTIGQDMIGDEFHDVYGRLKMIQLNLSSRIDRMHLLYQLGDRTWTVHRTFLFKNKSQ
jgi:2'-5' RNA ligase